MQYLCAINTPRPLQLLCTLGRQNLLTKVRKENMRKQVQFSSICLLFSLTIIAMMCLILAVEAKPCKPSGMVIEGKQAPGDQCDPDTDDCCQANKIYETQSVSKRTKAILTINNFQKGGDGGGPSECDNKYHSNKTPVVALSTRWFNHFKRCHKYITIYGNGRSAKAMVVDECDSTRGCRNDIVDASEAVWKSLKVPKKDWGWMEVFWSDN